jgi:glycosyltransferase involved in cell wall biosynthesis
VILVSFIIPTLNAQKNLRHCLKSIRRQNFNQKTVEILIIDGGSTDKTLKIAKQFNSRILPNPLKTGEAGKAVGLKNAKGDFFILLDSDNLLPNREWLNLMLSPLQKNLRILGSEPLRFTYRRHAGYIERYSSLIGANDPYAFITGVYDKQNYLNFQWTKLKVSSKDLGSHLIIRLKPSQPLPTIGANGTVYRKKLFQHFTEDYFFDIDFLSNFLANSKHSILFAKVKTSIIHTYCEASFLKFLKKQQRRIVDFYQFRSLRQFNWSQTNQSGIFRFSLYSLLLPLPLFDSIRGFIHKPDPAWFFHPLACLSTFFLYAYHTVTSRLGLLKPLSRQNWGQ